jgi:hypothetical protein
VSIISNQFKVSWPSDRTGWRLQAQTNSFSQGLSTSWSDVPGSIYTNQVIFPFDSTDGSLFYRLIFP